ncbi:hypothetical protein O5824_27230, partial [Escherichia coli]|nr:hypothetical protein [Escherichia coli]
MKNDIIILIGYDEYVTSASPKKVDIFSGSVLEALDKDIYGAICETGLAEYEHYEWPGDYFTKSE